MSNAAITQIVPTSIRSILKSLTVFSSIFWNMKVPEIVVLPLIGNLSKIL
jgi:hypothetical protein